MTTLIITIVILGWIASAIVRTADKRSRERHYAAARNRERSFDYRLREAEIETKRLLAESKAETERIIALEKARIEQEKWNAKQEEINRKQEEKNKKMEADIMNLRTRIEKAEADIAFLQEDIETLSDLRHPVAMELHNLKSQKVRDDYRGIGNPARDAKIEKLTKQVRQYDKQIHAAQQKIRTAESAKEIAEMKIGEVA